MNAIYGMFARLSNGRFTLKTAMISIKALSKRINTMLFMVALCVTSAANADVRWFEVRGGTWKPDQKDMVVIETKLKTFVSEHAMKLNLQIQPWQMYKFQYQGQGEGVHKEIVISSFCSIVGAARLSHEWLVVKDGGTCFFRVKYSLDRDSFYGLMFNGEA